MAIKIDLIKAYDRISWNFIEDTLKNVGYPANFIKLAMYCVCSPSMQVLRNGYPTEEFFFLLAVSDMAIGSLPICLCYVCRDWPKPLSLAILR